MSGSEGRREKAMLLRSEGKSLGEIVAALGCSKSSASLWTRGVDLPAGTKEELAKRGAMASVGPRNALRRMRREREVLECARLLGEAAHEDRSLLIACCMLFAGEGSHGSGGFNLTNSDAGMLRFWKNSLMSVFGVSDGDFRVSVQFYPENGKPWSEVCAWWARELGLPESSFTRPSTSVSKASKELRIGSLPYGTARLLLAGRSGIAARLRQMFDGALSVLMATHPSDWMSLPVSVLVEPSAKGVSALGEDMGVDPCAVGSGSDMSLA